jgi:hypothetical protein
MDGCRNARTPCSCGSPGPCFAKASGVGHCHQSQGCTNYGYLNRVQSSRQLGKMAKHELPPKDADVIFLPQADAGSRQAV